MHHIFFRIAEGFSTIEYQFFNHAEFYRLFKLFVFLSDLETIELVAHMLLEIQINLILGLEFYRVVKLTEKLSDIKIFGDFF